jgi:glucan biosynthesis protein
MYGRSRIRRKPMRFYGNGVVWDAENEKRLCRFSRTERGKKGVLDTDDPRICAELIRLGYEYDGGKVKPTEPVAPPETETVAPGTAEVKIVSSEPEPPKPLVTADMKPAELREIGRGLGLKFPVGVTKVDMAKAINEAKK